MTLHLRALTEGERTKIERLTRARTAPVRLVARARIIELAAQRLTVPAVAKRLDGSERAVRQRATRFNQAGIEGLDDAPRSGRPPTYSEDERRRVIAKARGLPPQPTGATEGEVPPTCHLPPATCQWTLDRLQEGLAKDGLPIKRSQIRRILKAEHIKWQRPRTWLQSPDPEFAGKRGPSSGSTPPPRRAAR